MENIDIRILVSNSDFGYKDIAKYLGISRQWLSKLMSHELSTDNKLKILSAINALQNAEPKEIDEREVRAQELQHMNKNDLVKIILELEKNKT